MNEFANKATENFKTMKENIKTLTLGDILNIHNIIVSFQCGVKPCVDVEEVISMLDDVIMACTTDAICPKCGDRLFLSDCPQYDYVCFNCDENFYKCEVEEYE